LKEFQKNPEVNILHSIRQARFVRHIHDINNKQQLLYHFVIALSPSAPQMLISHHTCQVLTHVSVLLNYIPGNTERLEVRRQTALLSSSAKWSEVRGS
jgi:hypothetical protein